MQIAIIILSIAAAIGIEIFLLLNWRKIMHSTKEKYSFQEAVTALKNGHTIYRYDNPKKYMQRKVVCEGKEEIQYGTQRRNEKFSEGFSFYEDDVLSNNWIIEKVEKK